MKCHRPRLTADPSDRKCLPAIRLRPAHLSGPVLYVFMHAVRINSTIQCSCSRMSHVCALQGVLASLKVSLGTSDTKFSAALGTDRRISVAGAVKGSQSYLTRVGTFDVDLSLQGIILLVSGHRSTSSIDTCVAHSELICCPRSGRLACVPSILSCADAFEALSWKLLAEHCQNRPGQIANADWQVEDDHVWEMIYGTPL